MKNMFFSFLLIICILFIVLLGFGVYRFQGTDDLSNVDVISFQISLLEIMLAAIALGGGILAFLGWKEIQDKIQKEIQKVANEFKDEKIQEIATRAAAMVQERNETQKSEDAIQSIGGLDDENT